MILVPPFSPPFFGNFGVGKKTATKPPATSTPGSRSTAIFWNLSSSYRPSPQVNHTTWKWETIPSLKLTAKAPNSDGFQQESPNFQGAPIFRGEMLVSGRVDVWNPNHNTKMIVFFGVVFKKVSFLGKSYCMLLIYMGVDQNKGSWEGYNRRSIANQSRPQRWQSRRDFVLSNVMCTENKSTIFIYIEIYNIYKSQASTSGWPLSSQTLKEWARDMGCNGPVTTFGGSSIAAQSRINRGSIADFSITWKLCLQKDWHADFSMFNIT